MKEIAEVVKTTGRIAVVRIEKHPECDGCKACAFKNGQSTVKIKALNGVGAKTGDRVLVRAEKDNRLLASFIVYVIPVVLAGAGALIGGFAIGREVWAAVLCIAGLLLGFSAVFALDKILGKTRGFGMEVVEILSDAQTTVNAALNDVQTTENISKKEEENLNGKNV